VARTVMSTHADSPTAPEAVRQYVRYGSSPRGAQAIVLAAKAMALLAGRFNVSWEDITRVTLPALRHRIILNFEGEAEGVSSDSLVEAALQRVMEGSGFQVHA
jgi:MoxR-like ATPase